MDFNEVSERNNKNVLNTVSFTDTDLNLDVG